MLLFSYVISAALEIAITYIQYQGTGEIPWVYALLGFSSVMSIAIEFSAAGEAARKALKDSGKNLEQYDIISNFARTGIYFGVLFGMIEAGTGSVMACVCIALAMVMAATKM